MEKSADDRIKTVALWVGFLSGLTRIADYLEAKWPGVTKVIGPVISPEELSLLGWLLFLFAAGLAFWWLSRRMEAVGEMVDKRLGEVSEQLEAFGGRLQKAEGGKEPYVSLQAGEIFHPSSNPVLWKWDPEIGADGPFCPRHRERLFYRYQMGAVEKENLDEHWLSGGGWLLCPADSEEFKYVERHIQVKDLRGEAAFRLNQK